MLLNVIRSVRNVYTIKNVIISFKLTLEYDSEHLSGACCAWNDKKACNIKKLTYSENEYLFI